MRHHVGMIVLRNVLIIALLALALTVVPGGGNVAEALLTALALAFFTAIGLLIGRIWKETSLTRDVMSDGRRAVFYACLGALALMIVGLDELLASGPGTVALILISGLSVYFAVDAWRRANA
jgi:Kef-type K+ transport system membrane component KefB